MLPIGNYSIFFFTSNVWFLLSCQLNLNARIALSISGFYSRCTAQNNIKNDLNVVRKKSQLNNDNTRMFNSLGKKMNAYLLNLPQVI